MSSVLDVGRMVESIWNQHIYSIYCQGLWKGLAESHIFPYPLLNGLNLSVCQNTASQGLQTQQVWDRTHYPCLANTYYYWEGFFADIITVIIVPFPSYSFLFLIPPAVEVMHHLPLKAAAVLWKIAQPVGGRKGFYQVTSYSTVMIIHP